MSNIGNTLKVLSVNCQGLRDRKKRTDVLNYLKESGAGIICLQDTHLTENDLPLTKTIWNNDCYLHGKKTNARGVGILLNNNFECEILACNKDKEGNYLQLILKLTSFIVNLISIYAPNLVRPDFFMTLQTLIEGDIATDYNVFCGDFNLVLDPKMDSENYKNINNPKARQVVLNIINDYNLIDAFRTFHPDVKRYSWREKKSNQTS